MFLIFHNKKGFTLIELLVVISIISFISSIVLASFQSAKLKTQEASIKKDLQSIKTQAELSYSKTGDYSLVEQDIEIILKHINDNGGTAKYISSNNFSEGYIRYAVSVILNSDRKKNWSVSDSSNIVTWDTMDLNTFKRQWSVAQTDCKNSGGRLPTIEELKALCEAGLKAPENFFNSDAPYWSNNILTNIPSTIAPRAQSAPTSLELDATDNQCTAHTVYRYDQRYRSLDAR